MEAYQHISYTSKYIYKHRSALGYYILGIPAHIITKIQYDILRIIGFQRRQRTDHLMYAKALKKAQCERVEATILRPRLLFAGGVQLTNNERLTRRVMFGTMAGGENPGPGRPEKKWAQRLLNDLRVFRATKGYTESFPWCSE